ncbi:hypothetical protein BH10CYA1_BH10CYA1_28950 [soil metagenome]
MDNRTNSADVINKTAIETATHVEKAFRDNNKPALDSAMSEVNKFRESHTPAEDKAYTAAMTKRLEENKVLPGVSLFVAQQYFDKAVGGDYRLEQSKSGESKYPDGTNGLVKASIEHIQKNYEQIKNVNTSDGWGWFNANAVTKQDIDDSVKMQRTALNAYAPGKDGIALMDKITDADGNISHGKIAALKETPTLLSAQENEVLDDFSGRRGYLSYIPMTDDLSKARLDESIKKSGLNPEELKDQKRGARVATPVLPENLTSHQEEMVKEGKKEEAKTQELLKKDEKKNGPMGPYPASYNDHPQSDQSPKGDANQGDKGRSLPHTEELKNEERAAKIAEALKVHKGESYSHSAVRLLALAGNSDPSGKEIRDLSRQLQKAHHWKRELNVNESLTIDKAESKKNPALAHIFE